MFKRVSVCLGLKIGHQNDGPSNSSKGGMYYCCITHYSDVTMGAMASQITSLTIVYSTRVKENIKAPRH